MWDHRHWYLPHSSSPEHCLNNVKASHHPLRFFFLFFKPGDRWCHGLPGSGPPIGAPGQSREEKGKSEMKRGKGQTYSFRRFEETHFFCVCFHLSVWCSWYMATGKERFCAEGVMETSNMVPADSTSELGWHPNPFSKVYNCYLFLIDCICHTCYAQQQQQQFQIFTLASSLMLTWPLPSSFFLSLPFLTASESEIWNNGGVQGWKHILWLQISGPAGLAQTLTLILPQSWKIRRTIHICSRTANISFLWLRRAE